MDRNQRFVRTLLDVTARSEDTLYVRVITSEWQDHSVALPIQDIPEGCRDAAAGDCLIGFANTAAEAPELLQIQAETLEFAPPPISFSWYNGIWEPHVV